MSALLGKRVLVVGLGLHGGGVSAARFFARRGARVTVTDLRDTKALAKSVGALKNFDIRYTLGEHRKSDFRNCDIVIKNPDVPSDSKYIAVAKESGAAIYSDSGIFLTTTKNFVIGVTGTKGKTTVATLIHIGLGALGINARLVSTPGGISFLDALLEFGNDDALVSVCEFSSWDLEGAEDERRSPKVAVFTSFFADHLDRHKTMENYAAAKALIFRFQEDSDSLIIPKDDSAISPLVQNAKNHIVEADERLVSANTLKMHGKHNRMNAALAIVAIEAAIAHPLFPQKSPMSRAPAKEAIVEFPGLNGRFEFVGIRDGRYAVNDTTATNPGAAIAALNAVKKPVILIAGGDGKGLDYAAFADAIIKNVKHVAFLYGDASDILLEKLLRHGYKACTRGIMDMNDAYLAAWEASSPGDTILLSPGASSLNYFANEFERGAKFVELFKLKT